MYTTPPTTNGHIREAIQGVIEVRRKHGLPIHEETIVEVEVTV